MERAEVSRLVIAKAVELLEVDAALLQNGSGFASLGVDSLALLEYTLALEDVFDVEIPEEEVVVLVTVEELVDALVAKTAVGSAGLEIRGDRGPRGHLGESRPQDSKGVGADPVDPKVRADGAVDEHRLPQDSQVMRHQRLSHPGRGDQVTGAGLLDRE